MGGETGRKHGEEKEEGFSELCEVHLPKHTVCLDKNDSLRFELGVFCMESVNQLSETQK